jgi:putative transposase
MIDKAHDLPVVRQVQLLELSRSSVYYQPQPISETDLRLMRRIDELHLEHPFAGARMLRDMLKLEGHQIGRKHVSTLMKKLDIQAIYRKANTSRRNQAHRIYPYLLRDLAIDHPNQVWAMDATYIPMRRGFVYLSAVLDWATRRVLAWRLSNGLTADPRVDALEEAIMKYGCPEIMNTDQGSQFTSFAFIGLLQEHNIQVSMDGKRVAGAITSSSNASGNRSSTRRFTCTATKPFPRSGKRSPAILISTIAVARTQRLTGKPRIRLTSTSRRSTQRLNPRRNHLRTQNFCPTARGHLYCTAVPGSQVAP